MDDGGRRSRIPPGGVIGRPPLEVPSRAELPVRRFRAEGGISEPQCMHTADVVDATELLDGVAAHR